MKRIRGGAGLGDAIYLRPIVEHFLKQGEQVSVCCDYPDVFSGLAVRVEPFDRFNIDVLAHYTTRKRNRDTNQWQDICLSAGVDVPLSTSTWTVRNPALIAELEAKAAGRPIIIVHGGRVPMARTDGFGRELLPEREAFETVLATLESCFLVQVGKAEQLYPLSVHCNMNGRTSVSDLLDMSLSCDGLVGQCSYVIPLAEIFDKPLLTVWAARGMEPAMHYYISSITPQKVLSKQTSRFVVDDWPTERIEATAAEFLGVLTLTCDS